jgi:hypothetical protein
MKQQGYFSEISHEIEVVIPLRLKDELRVIFIDENGKEITP